MSRQITQRVQSQEVINVSQDFSSDPVPKNTPPRSTPSPARASNEAEDRVQESLTDDPSAINRAPEPCPPDTVDVPTTGASVTSRRENTRTDGDTQALGAHPYSNTTKRVLPVPPFEDDAEEDLYGATPERKTQPVPVKSQPAQITETHSSLVAPLVPAASSSGFETTAVVLAREEEPSPQSAFLQSVAVNVNTISRGTSPRIKDRAAHTANMASRSKAMPSTGKLASCGPALARLRERNQAVQNRNAEISTGIHDHSATTRYSPAREGSGRVYKVGSTSEKPAGRPKAKERMNDSIIQPPVISKARASQKPVSSKCRESADTHILREIGTGTGAPARKRKAESEAATIVPRAGEPKSGPIKRAKATASDKCALPVDPRPVPMASSDSFQPDNIYDMPASPREVGRSTKLKSVARASALDVGSDHEQASQVVQSGTRKADFAQAENGQRRLRPRNAIHRFPVEDEGCEDDEEDKAEDVTDLDQAEKSKVKDPHAGGVVLPHKDTMVSEQRDGQSHEPGHTGDPKTRIQHPRPAASIVPKAALSEQSNPVGSQLNAIVLSDHSDLSSSIDQDSPPRENMPTQPKRPAGHFETPAAAKPSPPTAFPLAGSQSLCGTGRSRKLQIISFDKRGPRNQGSAPKKGYARDSVPPMTVAVSWGSETNKSTDLARKKASSVATSTRSGKSNYAAPPSNVATDVHDALAGLLKRGPPELTTTVNTFKASVPASGGESGLFVSKDATSFEDNECGFTTLNDLENFVNSSSPGQQLNTELEKISTASQMIMPPPNRKARSPQQAATTVQQSVSAIARPPLETSTVLQPKITEMPSQTIARTAADSSHTAQYSTRSTIARKSSGKRSTSGEAFSEGASKRAKAASSEDVPVETHDALAAEASAKRPLQQTSPAVSSNLETGDVIAKRPAKQTSATSTKVVRAEIVPVDTQAMPKPKHNHMAKRISPDVEHTPPKNETQHVRVRQAQPRQKRHWSQNSQTVDINGSPVPPDMEVNESATVLETFSQQASDSSGVFQHSSTRLKTPNNTADAVNEDAFSVPPSHQPPSLVSNTKVLPGPSGLSSQTIRHIKLTEVRSETLLSSKVPPNAFDPFARTGKPQRVAAMVTHKEPLLKRTVDFAQQFGQRYSEDGGESRGIETSPAQKFTPETSKPDDAPPEFAIKFASELDKQVTELREHTAFARAVEEDPDKTLVNDCSQDTEVSRDVTSNSSPVSSADASPDVADEPKPSSDYSGKGEDDLRVWRRSLKPHQLGLYEELVKIARVVTGYVAGQETAFEIMIDDNYRRELIMVEQEEEVQKKQYKQYLANLQLKRNEKIREMQTLEKVLQGVLDASAISWEEHCGGRTERERANRKIDGLIASLS